MLGWLRRFTAWTSLSSHPDGGADPRPLRERLQVFIGWRGRW